MPRKTNTEYRDFTITKTKEGFVIAAQDEEHELHEAGPFALFDDAKAHVDHELDRAAEQDEDATDPSMPMGEDGNELVDGDEYDRPGSVVTGSYKAKYAERALSMARKPKDVAVKALKRSTSDWLAIELARRTLDDKVKLIVPAFEAILDANGVRHDHWNRTTKGWQGRLRMTGRLSLQRVVAEAGELALPDGSTIPAPKNWIAKHTH